MNHTFPTDIIDTPPCTARTVYAGVSYSEGCVSRPPFLWDTQCTWMAWLTGRVRGYFGRRRARGV